MTQLYRCIAIPQETVFLIPSDSWNRLLSLNKIYSGKIVRDSSFGECLEVYLGDKPSPFYIPSSYFIECTFAPAVLIIKELAQ